MCKVRCKVCICEGVQPCHRYSKTRTAQLMTRPPCVLLPTRGLSNGRSGYRGDHPPYYLDHPPYCVVVLGGRRYIRNGRKSLVLRSNSPPPPLGSYVRAIWGGGLFATLIFDADCLVPTCMTSVVCMYHPRQLKPEERSAESGLLRIGSMRLRERNEGRHWGGWEYVYLDTKSEEWFPLSFRDWAMYGML